MLNNEVALGLIMKGIILAGAMHTSLPYDKSGFKAIIADLRQADDLLSDLGPVAGWYQRNTDNIDT